MLSDSILGTLDQPLDPDRVAVLRGGIPYLEGHDIIRTANRIFGYGGWSFEVLGTPERMEAGTQGQKETLYEVWAVPGRLSVESGGTFADVGVSVRQGEGSAALEMALKGAVTDAMKRCLRNYGDQFGLVLYGDATEEQLRKAYNASQGTASQQAPAQQTNDEPLPFEEEEDPCQAAYEGLLEGMKQNGVAMKWMIMALGGPEFADKDEAKKWWGENAFDQLREMLSNGAAQHWSDIIGEAERLKGEAA